MDVEEMGRRAVACKGWRWTPGMLALAVRGEPLCVARVLVDDTGNGEEDIVVAEGDGNAVVVRDGGAIVGSFPRGHIPCLTDPATLGCLLALVREAWGVEVWLSPEWNDAERWWMVRRVSNHVACGPGGSTQAEALVLALVAADARLLHVEAMNAHQQRSDVHPYTCANRGDGRHDGEGKLVATFDGWVCPSCDYTQRYW